MLTIIQEVKITGKNCQLNMKAVQKNSSNITLIFKDVKFESKT